ncbi:hypothetical protein TNCV_2055881 [Trichonephila clavipes]|nr:hypothetical protein TNCV_2055881 [Trichonephila clavipes]
MEEVPLKKFKDLSVDLTVLTNVPKVDRGPLNGNNIMGIILDIKNNLYQDNEQFVKEMLDNIVDERKSLEVEALKKIEREDKCLADQRAFELEKLKLQAQNPPASVGNSPQMWILDP